MVHRNSSGSLVVKCENCFSPEVKRVGRNLHKHSLFGWQRPLVPSVCSPLFPHHIYIAYR